MYTRTEKEGGKEKTWEGDIYLREKPRAALVTSEGRGGSAEIHSGGRIHNQQAPPPRPPPRVRGHTHSFSRKDPGRRWGRWRSRQR